MPTPESVSRDDLLAALKPLGDLLGVDFRIAYSPIVICRDSVTFSTSPPEGKVRVKEAGHAVMVAHRYSVEID